MQEEKPKEKLQKRERLALWPPPSSEKGASVTNQLFLIFLRIGSQALVLTQSWGSLRPLVEEVLSRLIARLSLSKRSRCKAPLFLDWKVDRMRGSSHLTWPVVQWRACFEMPEMCSSDLLDVVSDWCWLMRVLKLTRVWPT